MKRWPASRAYFWEEAPFFRLLLPLVIGIISYDQHWLELPVGAAAGIIAACLLLFGFPVQAKAGGPYIYFLKSFAIHTAVFLSGWTASYLHDIRNDSAWFGNYLTSGEAFVARVDEEPLERERTWKLSVSVIQAINGSDAVPVKGKAWVYIYKNERLSLPATGDVILLPAKWQPIVNAGNPFEFDYKRFAGRTNHYYQQFLASNDVVVYKKGNGLGQASSFIARCHTWAMEQLALYVKDKHTLGLLQSMLVGDRQNLDDELRQSYTDTGIVHIIAISGTHVGIFFFLVSGLLFWRRRKDDGLKYLLAIPFIWFYVLVAGAPVSAVRAALMFSFLGAGLSFSRNSQPLNTLLATAFFMLLFMPAWLFDVGFQLSFTAVLSLLIFYRPIRQSWRPDNGILRKAWSVIAASLAAEILIAPLVAYYFHLLPLTFLLANAFAFVFMFVVLLGGLVILALSALPVAALFVASVIIHIATAFNALVSLFQQLNPESLRHIFLSGADLLLIYLVIAGFAVFLLKKFRPGVHIALCGICLLIISGIFYQWNTLQQEMLVAYNINRADHVEYFRGRSHTVVLNDSAAANDKAKAYATREVHNRLGVWANTPSKGEELITVRGNSVLILKQAPATGSNVFPVDYLMVHYPVNRFCADELYQSFRFKKLILGDNQKRYVVERWRDSCSAHGIPAHFTALDGAFVLK